MLENLRKCSNIQELKTDIDSIVKENFKVLLWQNNDQEKQVIDAYLKNFEIIKEKLYINIFSKETNQIERKKIIYLYCDQIKTLIKAKINQLKKNHIQIVVSPSFYLEEKRSLYRMDVLEKNIQIELTKTQIHNNVKKDDHATLKDLCNQGCGLLINASKAGSYQKSMNITIHKIGPYELKSKIHGTVAHITPISSIGSLHENNVLIGIFFDLTIDNIDHILQRIEFNMS